MPSMASFSELVFACLDAVGAKSAVEVGAYRGELTAALLDWAGEREARIVAIDPEPHEQLVNLAERRPELELIRKTSHDALPEISLPDALIIDGDHNYYTVSEELRLIAERAQGGFPLVLLHDVGWPHARRDSYYVPDRIPAEHRQPLAHNASIRPGDPGVGDLGLEFEWLAEREGGPRNGVLTAVEDFVAARPGLRLATVPIYNGFGAVWATEAPWAAEVARILDPWDRNPILERLEQERLEALMKRRQSRRGHLDRKEALARRDEALAASGERFRALGDLFEEMAGSRAFAAVDRLAHLGRGSAPTWRRRAKRILRPPAR